MMGMKSVLSLLGTAVILAMLLGCSGNTEQTSEGSENAAENAQEQDTQAAESEDAVETGNTEAIAAYSEAPMLAGRDLPPVEERLPKVPKLVNENPNEWYEGGKPAIGKYGGKLRMITPDINFNPDLFIMLNEALLNTPGILGEEVTGNIVESYEVSPDEKKFTFRLREGLRWSDGEPVTTADVEFAVNEVMMNEKLTPVFPETFRSGGRPDGKPMTLEVYDDYTFALVFDEPYGGLLMRLAIRGWVGYTDILKPKHYLQQFHPNYTPLEQLEPLIRQEGFKEGEWWNLFQLKDVTNWENTNTSAVGFPSLQPWIMVKASPSVVEFERNPYYFKIDAAGNQLPYIDSIQSYLVQDKQMETAKMIAGEVDAANGILMNMPLYKENEEKGGYKTYLFNMHVTPADVVLNLTYDDPVWRQVVRDVRFRQALNMAIDREEIIDSIYFGFAELPTHVPSEFNPERANELLDEMGLDKRDKDGFRIGPDGKTFEIPFEVAPHDADMIPIAEMIVEFWNKVGVKTSMKQIDGGLWGTRNAANELQATVVWVHKPLWYYGDLATSVWAPLWNQWNATGGKKGEVPPEDVQQFYELMRKTAVSLPGPAKEAFEQNLQMLYDNVYWMPLVDQAGNPYIWNAKIKNVPTQGYAITNSFGAELVYYDE
jgi:peptide/nickel transport system substrate-binding protein